MNTKQIIKWFIDHNEIIKNNNDMDRAKYLAFLAGVFLKLNEEVYYHDKLIEMNIDFEDYEFDDKTTLLLNCINRYYGYLNVLFEDSGFNYLKMKGISSFKGKYFELVDYFDIAKEHCLSFKNYDFNKKVYYNGYNTYFYSENLSFTEEDYAYLNTKHLEQDTFELSRYEGRLVMF